MHRFRPLNYRNRYSSVGVVTGYGLDGQGSIPGVVEDISLLHSVQAGSGVHPASYQWVPGAVSSWLK
jgi:hypothetical protein